MEERRRVPTSATLAYVEKTIFWSKNIPMLTAAVKQISRSWPTSLYNSPSTLDYPDLSVALCSLYSSGVPQNHLILFPMIQFGAPIHHFMKFWKWWNVNNADSIYKCGLHLGNIWLFGMLIRWKMGQKFQRLTSTRPQKELCVP